MKVAGRVAAVLIATLIALAVAECVLRYRYPQGTMAEIERNNPAMYRPSDRLPYALQPGFRGRLVRREFATTIAINQAGLRGPELERGSSRPRILVVGDSFTFGWGVEAEEAYANRLAIELAERFGEAVEVVNAGFAACYSPDTYYLFLAERGLELDPDLIVIGFFIGNDLDHPLALENEWLEVDAAGLPTRIRNRDSKVDAGHWVARLRSRRYQTPLLRNSHLFQLAARTGDMLTGGGELGDPLRAAAASAGGPPASYRLQYTQRTIEIVGRVERLFVAIRDLAASRGIPLLVLMIPERDQLGIVRVTGEADFGKPQRQFGEFFARAGIQSLDLLPTVLRAPAPQDLYLPMDSHWNRAGHALAGRELASFVVGNGLIEAAREHRKARLPSGP